MSEPADESTKSLKEATLDGVRWLAFARTVSEIMAFGGAIVLARLVSPAEFGHAAVALILLPLGVILTFEGFASALVQRESIDESDRATAMAMSIVGGIALSGLVIGLADPVWRPVFGAKTAGLMVLMSPVIAVSALGGVSRATLWRRLHWSRMTSIDVASLAVGTVVSIVLAVGGLGARAIVIGALAQAAVGTALLLAAAPPPRPRWNRRSQSEIASFGIPASLAGLVDVMFRNSGYAILAARLTATQTGLFYRAFNLGVVYQDKVSRVMLQLAFPVYSRTTDRDELRRLHERAARVHAAVIFPLLASLIVLAPIAVPLVFGPAWSPAVRPTQVLAGAGMVAAILTGYPQVMLAVGKPRELLYFNIAMLGVYTGAVWLAIGHGLVVIAATVVAVYIGILIGVYRLLLKRHLGITLSRLIPELGPALAGCLALVAVTAPIMNVLDSVLPRLGVAAVVGAVGLVTYALVLRILFPATWSDVWLLAVRIVPPLSRLRAPRLRRTVATATPATQAPPAS